MRTVQKLEGRGGWRENGQHVSFLCVKCCPVLSCERNAALIV